MNTETLKKAVQTAESHRKKLSEMMRNLPAMGAVYKPTDAYEQALKTLLNTECNIAFCGKVNSGKSTLLNALLGRAILPTADRPMSSRIVEIENSEKGKEGFSLIFYDGTEKVYDDLKQLEKYAVELGSEVESVDGVELNSIMLIRVRCHMPELPSGIRLVDTPGIGASYENHSLLSYRYLQKAHAVVYVLKSDAPVSRLDQPFLEEVIKANKNIIFVQSCADAYDSDRVDATANRNLELLEILLDKKQNEIAYFSLAALGKLEPPSGVIQRRQYAKYAPNFEAFTATWRWMLARTAGLDALEAALLCTHSYLTGNIEQMNQRLTIAHDGAAEGERICLESAGKAREFREKWVGDAPAWANLVQELEKAVMDAAPDIDTRLESLKEKKILELNSITNENEAKGFGNRIVDDINAEWQWVQDACVERINRVLATRLEWEAPVVTASSVGRLLKNGSLVPLKLKDFGLGDLFRLGTFLVSVVTMNVVGVIWRGWRLITSIGEREAENQRKKAEAENRVIESFDSIRDNLQKQLKSKENPLAQLFKLAVAQAFSSVMRQHECLLQIAVDQLEACGRSEEQKQKTIMLLEGTPDRPGLLPMWGKCLDSVSGLLKELEQFSIRDNYAG